MSDFLKGLFIEEPAKVIAKTIQARTDVTVESTKWENGEKVKEEQQIKSEKKEVDQKFFREKQMYMSYDLGATLNLGNFNMGKISVSISMPVGTEITTDLLQKLNGTYDFMKKYVETKMESEVKEVLQMRR